MKRLIALGLVAAAATFGLANMAGASDEHAPHDGGHPHHRHTPDGECHDMAGPNFGGEHGGRHWGAVEGGEIHHLSCASAHP